MGVFRWCTLVLTSSLLLLNVSAVDVDGIKQSNGDAVETVFSLPEAVAGTNNGIIAVDSYQPDQSGIVTKSAGKREGAAVLENSNRKLLRNVTVADTTTVSAPAKANYACGVFIRLLGFCKKRPPAPVPSPVPAPTPVAPPTNALYDITLQFASGFPIVYQILFTNAKARWQSIIKGDLPDTSTVGFQLNGEETNAGCVYPSVIDDVYICAVSKTLPIGVLGSTYVTHYRYGAKGLPLTGFMAFDFAKGGEFGDVILHEMAHVFGLGTLWQKFGLAVPGRFINRCPYMGALANKAYQNISGCPAVPLYTNGKPNDGSYCTHWSEACLVRELMTPIRDNGAAILPLSKITIAGLEDLGYKVDYAKADPFGSADLGTGCTCNTRRSLLDMDHGETRQLGLGISSSTNRRLISEEARKAAIDYGLSVLAEALPSGSNQADFIDFGDQAVSVAVQDGEGVSFVLVRNGDQAT